MVIGKEASTFGKYQAKVKSLGGEVAQLKAAEQQQGRRRWPAEFKGQARVIRAMEEEEPQVPAGAQSHVVRLGGGGR